jgi:N-alpha-acetyltransferase 30
MIGVIIGKLERDKKGHNAGYVAMVVVDPEYRRNNIGVALVEKFIDSCKKEGADLITLETEAINLAALRLYEKLGFARTKRMLNYYLIRYFE